jgi:hypothetical protein
VAALFAQHPGRAPHPDDGRGHRLLVAFDGPFRVGTHTPEAICPYTGTATGWRIGTVGKDAALMVVQLHLDDRHVETFRGAHGSGGRLGGLPVRAGDRLYGVLEAVGDGVRAGWLEVFIAVEATPCP